MKLLKVNYYIPEIYIYLSFKIVNYLEESEKIISPPVFCNGIYIPNSALGIPYDQVHSGALKILQRNETISVFVSKMGLITPLTLRLEPSVCLASLKQEISNIIKVLLVNDLIDYIIYLPFISTLFT